MTEVLVDGNNVEKSELSAGEELQTPQMVPRPAFPGKGVYPALAARLMGEHIGILSKSHAEYRANLQQNLTDAMDALPKLATGIDVNVRFNGITGCGPVFASFSYRQRMQWA